MTSCNGYGMATATSRLEPIAFQRRDPRPRDVAIEILFCGVCHADVGLARGEWGFGIYPCVPGHEIVGRVTSVGGKVERFTVGDLVGVGPLVYSCRHCGPCKDGFEQLCDSGFTPTYMGPDADFGHTYGGYSSHIVVDENYVLRVPGNLDPAGAAPLLCAGITAFAPLKRCKVGPGMTVGVIGIGGVGHMGIKLAKAMGARVVALTHSPSKGDEACKLGADEVLVASDTTAMEGSKERFDVLLDTVSQNHDLNAYLATVRRQGEMILVATPRHVESAALSLVFRQKRLSGSFIGGIHETQELLDFCGAHNIVAQVERIAIDKINEAWQRMIDADVRYRFVIDMETPPFQLVPFQAVS